MKCIMRYVTDEGTGIFTVEGSDAECCRLAVNTEVERLGLEQQRNRIEIDILFDNRRSAKFIGIPCWYYADEGTLEGRNLPLNIMLNIALYVTGAISYITRNSVEFNVRVMY